MHFFDIINLIFKDRAYSVYPENVENIQINGIADNSKDVLDGFLFAAIPGYKNNGASFIQDAISRGATVILTEAGSEFCLKISQSVYVIRTDNVRETFSLIAKQFYNSIDEKIDLIGVTGTNGKTSTTTYISQILNACSIKSAVIGTLGGFSNDVKVATERTTPGILKLYEIFSEFVSTDVKAVAMEVSSHALELKRVFPLQFKYAVFTNLTEDHLDFHKTMEEYGKAKEKLFHQSENAIINVDDTFGKSLAEKLTSNVITYGLNNATADYTATDIVNTPTGSTFTLNIRGKKSVHLKIATPGLFSVYNALAALAVCIEYGISPERAAEAMAQVLPVNGRFETVTNHIGINVIIDYAHTPDGVKNVLLTAKEFTEGKIISVFGCGGQRDSTKRKIMGEISAELSDYTVITSDNPRNENELLIAYEISKGFENRQFRYNIIIDRQKAIEHAIRCAFPGDTVIIMGKGHETYQQIGDIKYPFCDKTIIKNILSRLST